MAFCTRYTEWWPALFLGLGNKNAEDQRWTISGWGLWKAGLLASSVVFVRLYLLTSNGLSSRWCRLIAIPYLGWTCAFAAEWTSESLVCVIVSAWPPSRILLRWRQEGSETFPVECSPWRIILLATHVSGRPRTAAVSMLACLRHVWFCVTWHDSERCTPIPRSIGTSEPTGSNQLHTQKVCVPNFRKGRTLLNCM